MAWGSSHEGPPNFITIMEAPPQVGSTEVSLSIEKLAVQDSSAGSAANHVVGKDRESPVENIARTQASHNRGHAVSAIYVKSRLRTVGRCLIDHGLLRRCWQLELLGKAAE